MPLFKAQPLPDTTVYNLRKRAEQMDAIANTVRTSAVHLVLHRRAELWRKEADEAERALPAPNT
jgi:hypothetical protein